MLQPRSRSAGAISSRSRISVNEAKQCDIYALGTKLSKRTCLLQLDEFEAVGAKTVDELRDLFVGHFYFGCEADDPMVAWAFNDKLNPAGAQLRPMFSSDMGHWDVPYMDAVLTEAFALVTDGHLDLEQFRTFTFENAVRFYACLDPGFFDGTAVEAEAAAVLADTPTSQRHTQTAAERG